MNFGSLKTALLPSATAKSLDSLLQSLDEQSSFICWLESRDPRKKGEKRLIVIGHYNIFSIKENGTKVLDSGHLIELVSIHTHNPKEIVITMKTCVIEGNGEEIDSLINAIRIAYYISFPTVPSVWSFQIDVQPKSRMKALPEIKIGPCGGYNATYFSLCNYFGLPAEYPLHNSIAWYIENLFNKRDRVFDSKKLYLQEYENLDVQELRPLFGALRFNNFFTGIDIRNMKLEREAFETLITVIKFNTNIEELVLSGISSAPKEAIQMLTECLCENTAIGLKHLDISENAFVEDKGLSSISAYLQSEQLAGRMKYLNISNIGATKQGTRAFVNAMHQNPSLYYTLSFLDISNNKMESNSLEFAKWLSTPNKLRTLNMANTNFETDGLFAAILGGCNRLTHLDVSSNIINAGAANQLSKLLTEHGSLSHLNISTSKFPIEHLKTLLDSSKKCKITIIARENDFGVAGAKIIGSCSFLDIVSLDISDNDFKDEGLNAMFEGFNSSVNPVILSKLIIDQNCTKGGKTKNFNSSMETISKFLNSEKGKNLRSLSIAGGPKSQLKSDIFPLLFALYKNTSITELNVSGHDMGHLGASILSKILQTNTTLQSLSWDENGTGFQGFTSFLIGLQLNKTLTKMVLPIVDISQALKENSDKIRKIQQLISDIERKVTENSSPVAPVEPAPKEAEITQIKAPDFLVKKIPYSISQRHIVSEHRASIDSESPLALRAQEAAKKNAKKEPENLMKSSSSSENQVSPPTSPKNSVDYQQELTKIVGDKKLAVVFREFLHQCFNSENFSFWLEVEDYKNLSESPILMKERAEYLVQKYFTRNSEFEINIDGTVKSQIISEISQDPKVSTFDRAQQSIWHLMVQDCVPKFLRSQLYKEYIAGQEVTEVSRERDVNFGTIRMLENFLVSGGKPPPSQPTIRRKSTKAQAVDFGPKSGSKTTDDISSKKQTVPVNQKFATLRV